MSTDTTLDENVCLVGVGRWLRCDDQAGLRTVQAIEQKGLPGTRVVLTETPAADILGSLDGIDLLVVVDAARPDPAHAPGTWTRLDYRADRAKLGTRPAGDSHSLSVEVALHLAEQMLRLPETVWIYPIFAADVGPGVQVSPEVAEAIRILSRWIPADIRAWREARELAHA